jgi:AAHS family 4-hydroxybenzoate transporter-like MFS transporter
MTTPTTVNVPDLIDEQKVGSFQIRILFLCAMAALLDGFAAQMIGYLAPSLARDMHLGAPALTRIFAWGLFGLMLGALSFGPIADRFGRKPVIVACTLFYGIVTLVTAQADSGTTLAI